MKIENFRSYGGRHCESSATGALLQHLGIPFSEAMILGLAESFGFLFWKMSILNLPFVGGRSKQFGLTTVLCDNLGLALDAKETTSKARAWEQLKEKLDQGLPVGLQLDCYHLEYFAVPFHFPGHFVVAYGYDDTHVYLLDTGTFQKSSIASIERARFEKGSMAAKARSWSITAPNGMNDIKQVIPKAIAAVANEFIHPALSAFGYKGIHKMGDEILHWIDVAKNPKADIFDIADIMENGGTGGALFRNMYRDFLTECMNYYPNVSSLKEARDLYALAAPLWTEVSNLLKKAGNALNREYLKEASNRCHQIAELELQAMTLLAQTNWQSS
jgi:hypothetical protein